jgi:hypothetical protein
MVVDVSIANIIIGAVCGQFLRKRFTVPLYSLAEDMACPDGAVASTFSSTNSSLYYFLRALSDADAHFAHSGNIDKAHFKEGHLDVEVISMHNLSRIPRKCLLLFIIMGLSSNSAHPL